jgi:hypothetical protein
VKAPAEAAAPYEAFKEANLALARCDADALIAVATDHFQKDLMASNRKLLGEAVRGNDPAVLRHLRDEFGADAKALLALPDAELLRLSLRRALARGEGFEGNDVEVPTPITGEPLERIRSELEKGKVTDCTVTTDEATLRVEDDGNRQIALFKYEGGRWKLDEVTVAPRGHRPID